MLLEGCFSEDFDDRLMPESEKGHRYILKLPTYVLDCLLAPEIYIRSYNVFALPNPNMRLYDDFIEVWKAFLSPVSLFIDQNLKIMEIG